MDCTSSCFYYVSFHFTMYHAIDEYHDCKDTDFVIEASNMKDLGSISL